MWAYWKASTKNYKRPGDNIKEKVMESHMEKIMEGSVETVKCHLKTEGNNLSHQLVVAREGEEFLASAKLRLPDRDARKGGLRQPEEQSGSPALEGCGSTLCEYLSQVT